MFYVYILQSSSSQRLYIGQTADIKKRLEEHNTGITRSTKGKGPWKLLYSEVVASRADAISLERKLKNWKNPGRIHDWIEKRKARSAEQRPDILSG